MAAKGWHNASDGTRAAAIIGACGVVLAAIVAGIFALVTNSKNSSPSPPIAGASSTGKKGASGCTTKLRITSPPDRTKVIGSQGVLVEGNACGLVNEHGWLFDYDYNDRYYHEDYSQSPGPIISSDGNWSFQDQPIGSQGDKGVPYSVTLVLADQQCNATLQAARPVGGDYRFGKFPPGCTIVDSRNVFVTWPS